ncbi:hypothetical protein AB6A40_002470 [Gnathostoma spinigerum]|uniref:RING-type domain-containing protein n=1 Tax=Gnathostoma spinigerum TaxID=75299 RepID=A0ABD6EEE2_9BILA
MDARCGCVLELNQILTFLPYELCLRYEKLVWGKVVVQKDWLFCENCQRAIHVNVCSNNNSHKQYYPIVACKCGHSHCVMCKRTWHWPLSCNLAERYNDVLESYGESMVHARRKKIVGLRRCPSCRSFFERSYGCNHITCACSYEFCYVCGGKWNSGAHYKCKAVERMKVTSVYLFDVIIGRCNDILKSFLNRNWEMREFRTPLGRWKLKKRTQWMRSDAETILKTCQAVLHVIEFCKIAVFSLHKNRGNSYTTSGSALTGRNGVLYFGSNSQFVRTVKRIKFINSRLDVALAQKKEASNVLFLRDLLVRHIRCLLSPCRIPSDVNP